MKFPYLLVQSSQLQLCNGFLFNFNVRIAINKADFHVRIHYRVGDTHKRTLHYDCIRCMLHIYREFIIFNKCIKLRSIFLHFEWVQQPATSNHMTSSRKHCISSAIREQATDITHHISLNLQSTLTWHSNMDDSLPFFLVTNGRPFFYCTFKTLKLSIIYHQ